MTSKTCIGCRKEISKCQCELSDSDWAEYEKFFGGDDNWIKLQQETVRPDTKGELLEALAMLGISEKKIAEVQAHLFRSVRKSVKRGLLTLVEELLPDESTAIVNTTRCRRCGGYYPAGTKHRCKKGRKGTK